MLHTFVCLLNENHMNNLDLLYQLWLEHVRNLTAVLEVLPIYMMIFRADYLLEIKTLQKQHEKHVGHLFLTLLLNAAVLLVVFVRLVLRATMHLQ